MPDWLKNVVIGVVTIAWTANVLAPIFVRGYEPSGDVNAVFLTIVGAYFGSKFLDKKDKE